MRLTTSLWNISKTKKKLSEDRWLFPSLIIALLGVFGILTFAMRTISLSWEMRFITVHIPVMSETSQTKKEEVISQNHVAIFMTDSSFYFGRLQAFHEDFLEIRNKFQIPHKDGAPQLLFLLESLKKWDAHPPKTVFLFVSEDWPMTIVLEIIQKLKTSSLFDHVILGGGFR